MYERIVVAIDGSDTATRALHEAVRLAQPGHARLRLVNVVDLGPLLISGAETIDLDRVEEAWCTTGRRILEAGAEVARAAGLDAETALLETDGQRVGDVIAADAASWKADLLVVGTHGRHGISHLLLGSVAEGVARAATVPVLLVRR
ncbi:MAG TPA: universal stress protein [Thermomicrobiaceae bacterium]|nr:universal stress protein [Thermomicrobiaceae bacterium]